MSIKRNRKNFFHLLQVEEGYFCFYTGPPPARNPSSITNARNGIVPTARSPLPPPSLSDVGIPNPPSAGTPINLNVQQTKDSANFSQIPLNIVNPNNLSIYIYSSGDTHYSHKAILFDSELDLPIYLIGSEGSEKELQKKLPSIIQKYGLPEKIKTHSIKSPKEDNDYGILAKDFLTGSLPVPKAFNRKFSSGDSLQFKDGKFEFKDKDSSSYSPQMRQVTNRFAGLFWPNKEVPLEQISLLGPYALKIGSNGKASLIMHNFEGKVLQSIDLPDRSEIGFTSSGEPLLYSNGNCSKVSSLFNAQNREIGGIELEKLEKSIPDDAQYISSLDGSTYYMVQRDANGKVTKLIPVSDPKEISNMSGGGKIPKIPGLTGAKTPEPVGDAGRQAVTSSSSANNGNTSGQSKASVTVNGQKKVLKKTNDGSDFLTDEENNLHLETFISSNGDLLMGVRANNLANGSIKLFTSYGKPIDIVDPGFSVEIRPGNVIETTSSNGTKKYFRVTHDSSRLDIKLEKIDSLPNRAQLRFEEKNVEVSRSPHSVVLDGQAASPDEEGLSTIPGTDILSFVAYDNRDGETSTEVYIAKNNKASKTPLKVHYTDGYTSDATNGTALIVGEGDVIEEVAENGKVKFLRVKSATTNGIELETINNKPVFSIEFNGQVIDSLPGNGLDLPGTTLRIFNTETYGQPPKLSVCANKEAENQSREKSNLIHHKVNGLFKPDNGEGYFIFPGDVLEEVDNGTGKKRYFKITSIVNNKVQIEEIASLPSGVSRFSDQLLGIFGFSLASNNSSNNAAQTPPAAATSMGTTPIRSKTGKSSVSSSDKRNEPEKPTTKERQGLGDRSRRTLTGDPPSSGKRNEPEKPTTTGRQGLVSRGRRTLTGDPPSSAQTTQRNPLNKKTTGQQKKQDRQPEVKKRKGLGEI